MNVLRSLALFPASLTYALAVANLIVSFKVLSPTPFTWSSWWGSGAGFLWMHIVMVVIPFQGFVTWGVIEVVQRYDGAASWRGPLLMVLCSIMTTGYVIIFRVELARLRLRREQQAVDVG